MKTSLHTNSLIQENSPYLLQHAHNPVNWLAWSDESLKIAQDLNRPIIISIGYSSCHWCHVMEHESFENENVAKLMNENFVCIKVDREEHPEIDAIYMSAIHLITGQGGWPLNCFALPDGRPFFGGTYFPKIKWMQILEQINHMYSGSYEKLLEYAHRIEEGIIKQDHIQLDQSVNDFDINELKKAVEQWKNSWDMVNGGPKKAPKFPLPVNLEFLLHYGVEFNDSACLNYVKLTLTRMAEGGIYDQIGGGFARYSTDMEWKVPHFEKMLYDNAQLISLYSHAYQYFKLPLFKKIIEQSIHFLMSEMQSPEGLFFSALDADSEGREGLFYIWKKEEIVALFPKEASFVMEYYRMNNDGYWEDDYHILMRHKQPEILAFTHQITLDELNKKVESWEKILHNFRSQRSKPSLDDKQLLGWNALMIKSLAIAHRALQNKELLQIAEVGLKQIRLNFLHNGVNWQHTYKDGIAKFDALFEDLAYLLDATIELYQSNFNEELLVFAKMLTEQIWDDFYDEKTGMFFFTNKNKEALISRKIEIYDNVTPAGNSIMAMNLLKMSKFFGNPKWELVSRQMLHNVQIKTLNYIESFGLWAQLYLLYSTQNKEIVITGTQAHEKAFILSQYYNPNTLMAATETESNLEIFAHRFDPQKTSYFQCINQSCGLPSTNFEDAQNWITKL